MSLINSFTHIQENLKFVIICVQNQLWYRPTVANLWGRHKDFTEFNENFEKSYLLNGLSNIVNFFTVWFLKIFCIKWIHIFFWVQCSFNAIIISYPYTFVCYFCTSFSVENNVTFCGRSADCGCIFPQYMTNSVIKLSIFLETCTIFYLSLKL